MIDTSEKNVYTELTDGVIKQMQIPKRGSSFDFM